MKIEITFDEEDNDYADITLDGQTVRATRTRMDARHTQEDSLGRLTLSEMFRTVRNILTMREIAGRSETWERLDPETIEVIEEEKEY